MTTFDVLTAAPGTAVEGGLLARLRSALRGEVIVPGDSAYEQARLVQNRRADKYPALIVRPAAAADVAEVVKAARAYDLPLAVRSGGHSIAAHGTVDGGLVLDLSSLKSLRIDAENQVAWAGAGLTWGEYTTRTEEYGLATPAGDTGSVGLGGLTLGGGIGWLTRKYGLTIDNLISAQVVTADGQVLTASAESYPDLFWALRGGGGNFGIVTEFQFRLQPVGTVLGPGMIYPATAAVLRDYVTQAQAAPDELTTIAFLMPAPPLPFIPADVHGSLVAIITTVYVGDLNEGHKVLEPFRTLGGLPPMVDLTGPMPYSGMYQLTADAMRPKPFAVRGGYLRELDDATIETALHFGNNPSSAMGMFQIRVLGGAMARVPAGATAFAHRDKSLFVAIINEWDDVPGVPADRHLAWTEGFWQAIAPKTDGTYVNFLEDEGEERIRAAYPPATLARLAEVKRRYDPTNLFRRNQNIKPVR